MKVILHALEIMAPPATVYENLTAEKGLAGWWSTKVSAPAEVGGVIKWTFEEGFNPDMEITELDPGTLVAWKCVGGHEPWQDNTFRFEIGEKDGHAFLRFRQVYAQELGDDAYGIYNFNWGYYLHSLKLLSEKGTGHPFSP